MLLKNANIFMHIFHISFILFSGLGWMYANWLNFHLGVQISVLFSWFVLGSIYKPGYCLLTAVHWTIRRNLGYSYHSDSYMVWLLEFLTGKRYGEQKVANATMGIFFTTLFLNGVHQLIKSQTFV